MSIEGKKTVVGLTGGIACYKVPYLIRSLTKAGAEVRVIMTDAATRFITPLTLETVSSNPVGLSMFPDGQYVSTRHIDLADWADLMVIAPATANFLGKTANGISDDLLTTIVCAMTKPVMIVPAMNPGMWHNRVTQANHEKLRELGFLFVDPVEGDMACDHTGVGRMAEPEDIFAAIVSFLNPEKKKLTGKRIVVTAGPTRENIDPVRYLTNHSSGKMGYAIAQAAVAMGAETTLISGPTSLTAPQGVKLVEVITTAELHDAVDAAFGTCDALIMAAAPSDFKPTEPATSKIKRKGDRLQLNLEPTKDILMAISAKKKPGQIVVGFALETDNGLANAKSKLEAKNLDMIVLNEPSDKTGFDHDTNQITIITADAPPEVSPLAEKSALAVFLLEFLSARM